MNTVILAAGLFPTTDHALAHLRRAHFIACCDGAADACLAAGFTPDLIVGDGDSVSPAVRHRWADRLVINPDQETNDLTKAVRHCLALGHRDLTLLGATGRREDHTLANIALLMDYARLLPTPLGAPPRVRMVSDFGTFYPAVDQITLALEVGTEVSIFSFGATHFSARGLQYPLYDFTCLWQGTLNVATRPEVRIDARGPFCVYVALPD